VELPDVVLSDISMPGSMNGIQLAFTLQKSHPTLAVLLTTGYAEQLDEAVAGGLKVLAKPVAPEELLAEIRIAVGSGST
jgi:CheY-like chemotaxis protein